jgi:hypothetical protein
MNVLEIFSLCGLSISIVLLRVLYGHTDPKAYFIIDIVLGLLAFFIGATLLR